MSMPDEAEIVQPIKNPGDLRNAIRTLKSIVDNGEITQLFHKNISSVYVSLDELVEEHHPADYFELLFKSLDSDTYYKLFVETYHGVGGRVVKYKCS